MNIPPRVLIVLSLISIFVTPGFGQCPVDPHRFQGPQSRVYTLDKGDTLGVFVEGVVGEVDSMPPINFPPAGSSLDPAMGFPTLVLHDGTIRLPNVDPVSVRGLTVSQVESLLKRLYRDGENPIIAERSRVIVSLVRKRTVNVIVIRGDQSQARGRLGATRFNTNAVTARSDGSAQIVDLQLPAGENDLLNAMVQSGGLPGVNARDQIQVLRSSPKPILDSRYQNGMFPRSGEINQPNSSSVAIRGQQATRFPRSSAVLNNGDIVQIASKPTEVYYTGGLLGGGEFAIPRDRGLSVMDAISLAGGVPQPQNGLGAVPLQQPRVLRLLRIQNGRQSTFQFDLSGGFSQQAANTQVRSGDYLILDYSRGQRVQNVGTRVINSAGVRRLIGN